VHSGILQITSNDNLWYDVVIVGNPSLKRYAREIEVAYEGTVEPDPNGRHKEIVNIIGFKIQIPIIHSDCRLRIGRIDSLTALRQDSGSNWGYLRIRRKIKGPSDQGGGSWRRARRREA